MEIVAALAAAGALVASGVWVVAAAAVVVVWLLVYWWNSPHAVATAATRQMPAQNKQILFIVSPNWLQCP